MKFLVSILFLISASANALPVQVTEGMNAFDIYAAMTGAGLTPEAKLNFREISAHAIDCQFLKRGIISPGWSCQLEHGSNGDMRKFKGNTAESLVNALAQVGIGIHQTADADRLHAEFVSCSAVLTDKSKVFVLCRFVD